MRLTEKQYNLFIKNNKKQNKYKNKKVISDGKKYDSKKESKRAIQLKTMEKLGIIKDLKEQVPYILQEKFILNGKTVREIKYIADFVYIIVETGEEVIEDVKGIRTEVYRIKKKMFMYKYKKEITEI